MQAQDHVVVSKYFLILSMNKFAKRLEPLPLMEEESYQSENLVQKSAFFFTVGISAAPLLLLAYFSRNLSALDCLAFLLLLMIPGEDLGET